MKDFTMVVKPLKGIIQHCKTVCIMYIMPSYIAKFQEGMHCLSHLVCHLEFLVDKPVYDIILSYLAAQRSDTPP